MTKNVPESTRQCEGDVLPLAIWQHMLLLAYPPFGGFDATTAASSRLAALIEIFCVRTTRIFAFIEARAHARGAASYHPGHVIDDHFSDFRLMLTEMDSPGAISSKKFSEWTMVHRLCSKTLFFFE